MHCEINEEDDAHDHADLMNFGQEKVRASSATGITKDVDPLNYYNSSRTPKECVANGVDDTTRDHNTMSFDKTVAKIHDSFGPSTLSISKYSQSQIFSQSIMKEGVDSLPTNSQFQTYSEIEQNNDDD